MNPNRAEAINIFDNVDLRLIIQMGPDYVVYKGVFHLSFIFSSTILLKISNFETI